MGDDGAFEVGFAVTGLLLQAEELQDQRLLEKILGAGDNLAFLGKAIDTGLVAAECEAFVEAGGFLPLKFGDGPSCIVGFDFVEAAFIRVLDGEQDLIMRPAQGKRGFPDRLFGFPKISE